MRVLVTGSAGFIGSHIVEALDGNGHGVVGIDVLPPRKGAPGTHLQRDVRTLRRSDGVFEAVVHLAAFGGVARAAREPRDLFEANTVATLHLVDLIKAMPACRRVVLASSFSVYGEASPVGDRTPVDPLEAYGASKLAQELAFRGSGLPLTVLRFSSVYGRRMRLADPEATILAKIAGWIARGETVQLLGDGFQTRDFVHVSDVVSAVRACLAPPAAPRRVNVCSGKAVSLVRAVEVLERAMNRVATVRRAGPERAGDMRHCLGDPTGLSALIGRDPTTFEAGAVEAFREIA